MNLQSQPQLSNQSTIISTTNKLSAAVISNNDKKAQQEEQERLARAKYKTYILVTRLRIQCCTLS